MTEYLCKHCGKPKGQHLAKVYRCPIPSRYSFKQYSIDTEYKADYTKPVEAKRSIL